MTSFFARLSCLAALALTLTGAAVAQTPPPPPPPPSGPPALPSPPPAPPAALRCVVPQLKGLTVPAAARKLEQSGCRLGKVTKVASAAPAAGRVVRQSISAGATRPAGTRVALAIGRSRI
jgi:hypothetical protein